MEPIIALATPPFKSALALLRLSRDGLFGIVSKFINKEIGTDFFAKEDTKNIAKASNKKAPKNKAKK